MPDGPDMDVFLELGRELLLVLAKNIYVKCHAPWLIKRINKLNY